MPVPSTQKQDDAGVAVAARRGRRRAPGRAPRLSRSTLARKRVEARLAGLDLGERRGLPRVRARGGAIVGSA